MRGRRKTHMVLRLVSCTNNKSEIILIILHVIVCVGGCGTSVNCDDNIIIIIRC